ncbi:CidA/LrgA family protein [Candidatus Albibeggiatoa sp. nov. BB20]|uniref:CidA/LrgA family protein n=1 Tax=Candidatus Albibeggiatoa sp. nov. BB20 TaxID=3162723 RepID=UPI0033658356
MDFIHGITILLIYQLIGEFFVLFLGLPIPGPVVGMILLLLTLLLRAHVPISLDISSSTLLGHLSLLFIPAGVGLMAHFELIANQWLPIVMTLILSTVFTMVMTAAIMVLSLKLFTKDSSQ